MRQKQLGYCIIFGSGQHITLPRASIAGYGCEGEVAITFKQKHTSGMLSVSVQAGTSIKESWMRVGNWLAIASSLAAAST